MFEFVAWDTRNDIVTWIHAWSEMIWNTNPNASETLTHKVVRFFLVTNVFVVLPEEIQFSLSHQYFKSAIYKSLTPALQLVAFISFPFVSTATTCISDRICFQNKNTHCTTFPETIYFTVLMGKTIFDLHRAANGFGQCWQSFAD